MPTTVTITSLVVPLLTDNTIAFANASAWNSYWAGAGFEATIPTASTTAFGVVKSATTTSYVASNLSAELFVTLQLDIGGTGVLTPYNLVLQSYIDSLVTKLNTLEADYIILKQGLRAAGLISNA